MNNTLETVLRRIVLVCLFIVPFIAMLVADSSLFSSQSWKFMGVASLIPLPNLFFPFITAKAFVFRIVVEIMFVAWLILAISNRKYAPKKSPLLYGVIALIVVSSISCYLSENPHKSFWSNFERMEGLFMHLHFAAYFLVAGTMLALNRGSESLGIWWRRFWQTSLGVSVVIGLYGLAQLAGWADIHQGSVRIDATLGNSAYFAVYAVFHLFIALYFLVRHIKRERSPAHFSITPYVYGAIALMQAIIVYFTATRGAIIGMGLGLIFVAAMLAFRANEDKVLRRTGYSVLGTIVVLFVAFIFFKDAAFVKNDPVLSRFASLVTLDISKLASGEAKSRFTIWPMAWKGALERPVFGWGQESFNYLFYKYYEPRMHNQEAWFDRAHNVFLDWLVSAGFIGLLAYLTLYGMVILALRPRGFRLIKNKTAADISGAKVDTLLLPAEAVVLGGLLIAYFVHNLFVFDNNISYILFFSLLAWLHGIHAEDWSEKGEKVMVWGNRNAQWLAPAIVLLGVLVLWFGTVRNVIAANTLARASGPVLGGIQNNVTLFKDALAMKSFANQEIREHFAQFATQAVASKDVDAAIKQSIMTATLAELKTQVEETPKDARMFYFYSSLLMTYGRFQEALPYALKAVELSPKKQILRAMLGALYLNMSNMEQAVEQFRISYEFEPSNTEALLQYGAALIIAHKDKEATDLLVAAYKTDLVPEGRIIQAYVLAKRFDKLAALFSQEVAKNPENTELRKALAESYYRGGNKTKAIAELKKAIKEIPSFKEEGEALIKMLQS